MNENKIWKTAIYLRLSKEDDNSSKESESIKNQRDLILNYVKIHQDIEVVQEYCDDGVSGVNFDRPSFIEMLDMVRLGVIDCIIVKDLSRFGRNHIEAGKYIENIFPALGVRFIAINDGIDSLNKKSDNIIVPFKNLINDMYLRDISLKIRSQFEVKRKQGLFAGAFVAYGYLKDENNRNKLIIDEDVCENIREIYRLKLSGVSAEKIADRFNTLGILSPMEYKKFKGQNFDTPFKTNVQAKWSATTILRTLKNPLYIGTLTQGKEGSATHKIAKKVMKPKSEWVSVPNNYEPIIDEETFLCVQKALQVDTRTSPKQDGIYIFSGLLFCPHCGSNMIRKTVPSNGKTYVYYVCGGNKKAKNCTAKGMRDIALEKAIFIAVKSRIAEVVALQKVTEFLDNATLLKIRVKKLLTAKEQKEKQLAEISKYKKALYEAYIDKTVSENDYNSFYKDYEREYEEIGSQIGVINEEIEAVKNSRDKSSLFIESFKKHQNIECLNRAIIIELIDRIYIHSGKEIDVSFSYKSEYEMLHSVLKKR